MCNPEFDGEKQIEIPQVPTNIVEQDYRFIKEHTRPTLGFKNFYLAAATITGIENISMIQKGQILGFDSSRSPLRLQKLLYSNGVICPNQENFKSIIVLSFHKRDIALDFNYILLVIISSHNSGEIKMTAS